MSKIAWRLLIALLASNAAWIATAPVSAELPKPARQSRVPELQAELTRLEQLAAAREEPSAAEQRTPRVTKRGTKRGTRRRAAPSTQVQAWQLAKPWIDDVLQVEDDRLQNAAIESIRAALTSGDPVAVQAALHALSRVRQVRFDRESFRPLVLPQLKAADPVTRRAALYALFNTKATPADLDLVLPMVNDPDPQVRTSVPHIATMINKGDLSGAAGEALLKLLHDPDFRNVVDAMRGLGGVTKHNAEVIDRFLELAEDKTKRPQMLHFAMMNMPKPKRVIVAMLGYLEDGTRLQSMNLALMRGIPKQEKDFLAREGLARLEKSTDDRTQSRWLEILRCHADARHRETLQRLIDEKIIRPNSLRSANKLVKRLR
ncbi:MAG: hypothetical protein V3T86_08835 [Planctomycetota bacterium]